MSRTLSVLDTAMSVSIALAAAFEAAIEAQRGLPETEMIVPITGWLHLVPLSLLLLVGCLWLCRLLLPSRRRIEILAPLEDEIVPQVREVRGSVWPPGEPLQILVLVGREWKPQQLPSRDGAFWSAQCHFGTPTAGADADYKIAAISRKTLIIDSTKRLPWWSTTRSNVVRVSRS